MKGGGEGGKEVVKIGLPGEFPQQKIRERTKKRKRLEK